VSSPAPQRKSNMLALKVFKNASCRGQWLLHLLLLQHLAFDLVFVLHPPSRHAKDIKRLQRAQRMRHICQEKAIYSEL
jgi:hypothetical protein